MHGKVVGGALDLVCTCDIRYASQETEIVVKEIDIGMATDLGTL
jgi:enoyl-CoA hydratase/carnithine racemase